MLPVHANSTASVASVASGDAFWLSSSIISMSTDLFLALTCRALSSVMLALDRKLSLTIES
jgi:hypothetical protein